MLSDARIETILERIPTLTFGVLGDLFLDRYLDLDASLTEPSIETGLDAYQVARVRSYPGAAGTVVNNLHALGAGRICPVAVIGDDGEGYELRQALGRLKSVDASRVIASGERRTPTYTKPMLHESGRPARELNRLDIKNHSPLPAALESLVLRSLDELWPRVDVLLVLDQVSEAECGVVRARVRERLAELSEAQPAKMILADSRERIGLFRSVWLKPNEAECRRAVRGTAAGQETESYVRALARQSGRPVFCTRGKQGIIVADPRCDETWAVPAFSVEGPIDIVGAGDSASAGVACAIGAGATPGEAAAFGSLVASITIQQLGTTGTASPDQVRQRWQAVRAR
jgi:bifunctional ADP-heptose synthase (sugar kinase/adenylyltransferase)